MIAETLRCDGCGKMRVGFPGKDTIDLGLSTALGAALTRFRLAGLIHFVTTVGRALFHLIARFLPGVVSYIPATTLKVKTVQRHKLL